MAEPIVCLILCKVCSSNLTAQLIDALTGYHLWAESYDKELTDVFALQDDIASKLINVMEVELTLGEQARLWGGAGTTNIMAYDKLWRGIECYYGFNTQDVAQARKFAKEAIKLDKKYALSYVLLGFTFWFELSFGRSNSPLLDLEEMEKCALKALELNGSLDLAHDLLGIAYLAKRQHKHAIEETNKAVTLNPNRADAHAISAYILNYSGKPQRALEMMNRAFRFNPIPPSYYYSTLGITYRLSGRYLEAIEASKQAILKSPEFAVPYTCMAASYGSLEQYEKAHDVVKEMLRIDWRDFTSSFLSTLREPID